MRESSFSKITVKTVDRCDNIVFARRSGQHDSANVSVGDCAIQLPRCVRYTTSTASHRRHLSVQCLRPQRITRYTPSLF